jgi:hypothetical protein
VACSICAAQTCPQDQPKGVNPPVPAPQNTKVCRYNRPQPADHPSYWWLLLYELFKWKPAGQPPFRKSVAFLAGVSRYTHMSPQLDFVKTDLTEFRNFLLNEGGFDTVYEVRDANVSRQTVEDFMVKNFSDPKGPVGPEDRLLFYYSGHGGAQAGREPYLLFQDANPPDYTNALRVRDVFGWAVTIPAKHLMIILDSCFSGLARDKANEDVAAGLSNALAGEPSGLLLTAGTDDERAYAVQYSKQKNGSIFTHALIDALKNMSRTQGIVTIGQAFEQAKVTVAAFDAVANKKMTPLSIPLAREGGFGKGNFIFINPKAENPAPPSGLYGGGSLIAKAADSTDPNLTLIQKEYDEVKNSNNLAALHAFDVTYKGKPFGQTLVSLIEEKINGLERQTQAPNSVVTPTSPSTEVKPKNSIDSYLDSYFKDLKEVKPKDFKSDVIFLSHLAETKLLQLVQGSETFTVLGNLGYWHSTFVITGATRCSYLKWIPITVRDSVDCTFTGNSFSFQYLVLAAKSALPNWIWGKETSDIGATDAVTEVEGTSPLGAKVLIRKFSVAPEEAHIILSQ